MDTELEKLIEEKKALGIPETMEEIARLSNVIRRINEQELADIDIDTGSMEPLGRDDEYRPLKRNGVYTEKEMEAYLDGKERARDINRSGQ